MLLGGTDTGDRAPLKIGISWSEIILVEISVHLDNSTNRLNKAMCYIVQKYYDLPDETIDILLILDLVLLVRGGDTGFPNQDMMSTE